MQLATVEILTSQHGNNSQLSSAPLIALNMLQICKNIVAICQYACLQLQRLGGTKNFVALYPRCQIEMAPTSSNSTLYFKAQLAATAKRHLENQPTKY